MSKNAIDVDHVSIRFNLANEKINNLKEYAIKLAKHELMFQEFLALKDVSLHVKRGEAWGLIGTNGSGKSTLLKTIAGILKPYTGTVKVRGSIAPMIELGAGFDAELTARENIFLNGAVLGHPREFMQRHFDEIVDFAGVRNFLDSPVKNFSSGMKARLGFAVATVVDPDILIVDEVLSVGDFQFRRKCNDRMTQMLAGGTTLLYVSHDIASVKKLCTHALWLDRGDVIMAGEAGVVCDAYSERQEEVFRQERLARKARQAQKNEKYDYLVVGAGLFGACFAREAQRAGKRALVIDRRDHVAGNVHTRKVGDIHVHSCGPHIFHTDNEAVWYHLNGFSQFNSFINAPLVKSGEELYHLPFNMNTFNRMWGVLTPQEAREKIDQQIREAGIAAGARPRNLEEQAILTAGRDVYEKLVKGYTQKQWGRDCRDLPAFLIRRLPIRFTYDNRYYNEKFQGIPEDGYTAIVEKMLEEVDVLLNTDYKTYVAEHPDSFRKVVYTGSIDEYFDYRLGRLEYRSARFETQKLDMENYQGNAVVNYADPDVPWIRITEHRHFTGASAPFTVITREYPVEWEPGLERCYPVNDQKNQALYEQYKALADQEENVIFGGRLGDYKYYNMDEVVLKSMELAQKEFKRKLLGLGRMRWQADV